MSRRGRPVLACDECDLIWFDPRDITLESATTPLTGAGDLPDDDTLNSRYARPATRAELEALGWWPYVSQPSRAEHGDEILSLPDGIDVASLEVRQRDRTAEITFEYSSPGGEPSRRGVLRFDWVQYLRAERAAAVDALPGPVQLFERLDSDLRQRLSTRSPATTRHFHLQSGHAVFDVVAATVELDAAVESDAHDEERGG
jgi:hypothetical protein